MAILVWDNTKKQYVEAGRVAPSAPADADLQAGDIALWYDDTHLAAKLMVKAKDANGVVVSGEVALA